MDLRRLDVTKIRRLAFQTSTGYFLFVYCFVAPYAGGLRSVTAALGIQRSVYAIARDLFLSGLRRVESFD